jgi:hypothetical protein
MYVCLIFPSRVAGMTAMFVFMLFYMKYSVSLAPSVSVCVAPTRTNPVMLFFWQDSATTGKRDYNISVYTQMRSSLIAKAKESKLRNEANQLFKTNEGR